MNYEETIADFKLREGWPEEDARKFVSLVVEYLEHCGYFIGDFNIHGFERPEGWENYSDKGFGRWILDLAVQWNMEHGRAYKYEEILDFTDTMPKNIKD